MAGNTWETRVVSTAQGTILLSRWDESARQSESREGSVHVVVGKRTIPRLGTQQTLDDGSGKISSTGPASSSATPHSSGFARGDISMPHHDGPPNTTLRNAPDPHEKPTILRDRMVPAGKLPHARRPCIGTSDHQAIDMHLEIAPTCRWGRSPARPSGDVATCESGACPGQSHPPGSTGTPGHDTPGSGTPRRH